MVKCDKCGLITDKAVMMIDTQYKDSAITKYYCKSCFKTWIKS